MTTLLIMNGGVLEHHLNMFLRTNSHILLAKVSAMGFDVGIVLQISQRLMHELKPGHRAAP
jgi:hypothetical protein